MIYHQLDVTNNRSIKQCLDFTNAKFEKLDSLLNYVGIDYYIHQNIKNTDLDEILNMPKTNTSPPLQRIQTFFNLLEIKTEWELLIYRVT